MARAWVGSGGVGFGGMMWELVWGGSGVRRAWRGVRWGARFRKRNLQLRRLRSPHTVRSAAPVVSPSLSLFPSSRHCLQPLQNVAPCTVHFPPPSVDCILGSQHSKLCQCRCVCRLTDRVRDLHDLFCKQFLCRGLPRRPLQPTGHASGSRCRGRLCRSYR